MKKWKVLDAFRHLGAQTNNPYAWSAQSADKSVTVLTLWEDEISDDGDTVQVDFYGHPKLHTWQHQRGNKARHRQLQELWNGSRKFKVVMLRAKDTAVIPRQAVARWPDEQLTMTLTAFDTETGAFRAEGTRLPANEGEAGSGWSNDELDACVRAYRRLWQAQQRGERLNKSALRREIVGEALSGRGEGAYERRMQNISAVMDALGLPYVEGYLPLKNMGAVRERIIALINKHWQRTQSFELPTADEDELATRVESALQRMRKGGGPPPPGSNAVGRIVTSSFQFVRDPNVIAWVREEAGGSCEACGELAPFAKIDGEPYLEVHHIRPLSEGGPDTVDNAIAGCPNCHRRLHFAEDRDSFRRLVIKKVIRLVDHPKRRPPEP